jgi:hypothetical protein
MIIAIILISALLALSFMITSLMIALPKQTKGYNPWYDSKVIYWFKRGIFFFVVMIVFYFLHLII